MSGRELGRISGPLLANNLRRNGSNLAFETKLLYLNVNGSYIGVNTNAPSVPLDVNGTARTTNLVVGTQANVANLEFYNNVIQNVVSNITFSPGTTTVVPQLQATNLFFSGNTLSSVNVVNNNINIGLTGATTAQIKLNGDVLVSKRNLLKYSEQLDNAAWLLAATTVSADVVTTLAPNGTQTVEKIIENSSSVSHNIQQGSVTKSANAVLTLSVYAKAAERSWIGLVINDDVGGFGVGRYGAEFDLLAGTASNHDSAQGTFTNGSFSISVAGNGWYRCSITCTTSTEAIVRARIFLLNNTTGNLLTWTSVPNYTGNGASGLYLWGAQIEQGTLATSYVPTTNGTQPNLHATGDITWDGNITLGDAPTDTVSFAAEINSNILPFANNTYNLGENTTPLTWANTYSRLFTATNTNTTNLSTTTFTGSGTNNLNGNVIIGTTSANTVTVTARFTNKVAPLTTNTYDIGSSIYPWNNIYGVTFNDGNITVTNNTIQTTTANSNLQLVANGVGKVIFSKANVTGNVTIGGALSAVGLGTASTVGAFGPNVLISDFGKLFIGIEDESLLYINPLSNFAYNSGTTTLANTTVGGVTLIGDYNQTGNLVTSGTVTSGSITSSGKLTLPAVILSGTAGGVSSAITGINTNTNLVFTPVAGQLVEVTSGALVDQNATVSGTLTVGGTSTLTNTTTGDIALVGAYNQTGNFVTAGTISSGSITAANPLTLPTMTLNGSVINGTAAGSNLILTPNTGQLVDITSSAKVDSNLSVGGTLTVGGTSTLTNTTTGAITLVGAYNQTGNFVTAGTIDSGSITAANPLTLPNITINNSTITGTNANTDLTLTPKSGFTVDLSGSVGTTTQIDQNLTVGGTLSVYNTSALGNTTTGAITLVGDYNQTGNFVTAGTIGSGNIGLTAPLTLPALILSGTTSTTAASAITGINTNTDLILTPYAGQKVKITSSAKIDSNLAVSGTLTVGNTSTLTNTTTGAITLVGDYNQTGNFQTTGTIGSGPIISSGTLTLPTFTVTNSTFTGTVNNNLTLTPYSGKVVEITDNAQIDQSLTVAGTLTVGNISTLANTTTDAITLVGDYNQTGNLTVGNINSGSIDIGVNVLLGNPNDTLISQYGPLFAALDDETLLYVNNATAQISNALTLPTVQFNGSSIIGTANGNLILTAASGKVVEFASPVQFDGNVSVAGTLNVTNTSTLVATTINGSLTQTGNFNQTGNTTVSGNAVANNIILTGLTDTFSLGNFVIGGQTITVNPTGLKTNNSVNLISQNSKLFIGLEDESLTYVNTRGDSMTFLANGTGNVWLGNDLKVNGNTIINNWINYSVPLITEASIDFISETGDSFYSEVNPGTKIQNSIYFTPTGTGSVVINTGRSVVLPSSHDSVSVLDTAGELRFNDVTLNYEGYISPGYVNFINLYSQDQKTYITPELSPGAADNTLRFGINNTVTTTITSTALTNNNLTVNNAVNFTGTTISNTNGSSNINLYSTGTKLTNFNGINYVKDSTINAPTSGALTFQPTGAGYVQFGGTNGFAIPVGSDSNYPVSPITGTLRFNSTKVYPEIFNGTVWVPAYGISSQPSAVQIQDLVLVYELVLGF
jgi:hypothetical protein